MRSSAAHGTFCIHSEPFPEKKKIPVLGFPEVDTELKDVKRPPCWVLDRGGSESTE